MKIRGNAVGAPMPRPNLNQTDPAMGDYIPGREEFSESLAAAQSHAGNRENPHGVTLSQLGAAAAGHSHTAADVGAVTAAQVQTMIGEALGVIENGTY